MTSMKRALRRHLQLSDLVSLESLPINYLLFQTDTKFPTVIQGQADTKSINGKGKPLTQAEVEATIDFCLACDNELTPDDEKRIQERLQQIKGVGVDRPVTAEDVKQLTAEEREFSNTMSAKHMLRRQETMNTNTVTKFATNGFVIRMERGALGLVAV